MAFNGSTNLTVTTPAGPAGAADVKVTNPDGKSAVLALGFVYMVPLELHRPHDHRFRHHPGPKLRLDGD